MLIKINWRIYRIFFCVVLFFCIVNLSFAQSEIYSAKERKRDLEASIADLEQIRNKVDSILNRGECLHTNDSIKILQDSLQNLLNKQHSFETDSLLIRHSSNEVNDAFTKGLIDSIKLIKQDVLLTSKQIKIRVADTNDLSNFLRKKKTALKMLRDTISQQLAKDTSSIQTYQKTILKALEQEDYYIVRTNIEQIKTIIAKQFYTSEECESIRKSFSNRCYANEHKYREIKQSMEELEQVVTAILKADTTLNQKYSIKELRESLEKLDNILNLKLVKQINPVRKKVDILSSLLHQYCKESNDAYDMAEYVVNGLDLTAKEKQFISNLKSNYPYLYSIFRTKDDKKKLFENSVHPLTKQYSCN